MTATPTSSSSSSTTTTHSAAEIRRAFIDFFVKQCGHTFAPSSPVIPHNDPTLLFTNAGMNQFKDVFLGRGERDYTRAVNTQKCIRAGGKHNDLEDVGRDCYHHTFFEMLGNWSFGDYFKQDAINWAWKLLTEVWGIDPDRLYATYFEGNKDQGLDPDTEARDLWQKHLPKNHVITGDMKDNFWEMGETGPCGPCSEIHYDGRPDAERKKTPGEKLVNRDHPDVLEIWNLVFIQFDRGDDRKLTPLPAKHVDTGMGLERIVRVLQGKSSNYDTDLFTPIFKAIQEKTGAKPYGGKLEDDLDIAYRVVADHIRTLTIAITDGGQPGNEGRGYVLRRILRRAVRHARQTFGATGPILNELVPVVIQSLGETFPELKKNPQRVQDVIRGEEEAFLRTLDRGIEHFWFAAGDAIVRAVQNERLQRKAKGLKPIGPYAWNAELPDPKDVPHYDLDDTFLPRPIDSQLHLFEVSGETLETIYKGPISSIDSSAFATLKNPAGQPRVPTVTSTDAFKLHDTYGFPIDLTQVMAEERGLTVDIDGFSKLMEEARAMSRAGGGDEETKLTLSPDALARLKYKNIPPTVDKDKYHGRPITTEVRAIWNGTDFDNNARPKPKPIAVILERTSCYAESGGQVGDVGSIRGAAGGTAPSVGDTISSPSSGGTYFKVTDTQRAGDYILHIGTVQSGALDVGDRVVVDVEDRTRNPTMAHHTTTHLLNHALRQVLGEEIEQRGSLVAPDKLRFDFSFGRALEEKELNAVERLVNAGIHQKLPVHTDDVPLAIAKQINGVRAVFGEKYPDPVRVVSIGPSIDRLVREPDLPRWRECSIEFCGGTHLGNTETARRFVITQETALAAGIRRITAVAGPAALAADMAGKDLESRAFRARGLAGEELVEEFNNLSREMDELTVSAVAKARIRRTLDEVREKVKREQKRAQSQAQAAVVDQARVIAENITSTIIVDSIIGADKDTLLAAIDVIKAKRPDSATMLLSGSEEEQKVMIAAFVPKALIDKGLKAGDWVKEAAKVTGGGGGGRPDMAQAGGKDPKKINDAINAARAFAQGKVK